MKINPSLAVPSYVIPASTKENILFLRDKTPEISLLCFEPSLPVLEDLSSFQGSWHLHLPYSVPHDFYHSPEKYMQTAPAYSAQTLWNNAWQHAGTLRDMEIFAKSCIKIALHCQKLNPKYYVLHLPDNQEKNAASFLEYFLQQWQKELPLELLCLENVKNASYFDYEKIILSSSCSLCFDLAHALTYKQENCLEQKKFMEKVKIVHWSAPFEENTQQYGKDKHLNLNHLKNHASYCIKTLKSVPQNTTHVLELFSWEEIEKSKQFLFQLFDRCF